MKIILTFACLALYVAHTQAQTPRSVCQGRPVIQVCTGGRDEGNGNLFTCRVSAMDEMWFHAGGGRCNKMRYKGCGGNNNRYCSVEDCRRRCPR